MAELTRDETRYYHLSDVEEYPVAAGVTVYEGAAVGENGSGYARPLIAGDPFLGFASQRASNVAGVAGAERVPVKTNGLVKLLVAGVTVAANKGAEVYAANDGTFTVSAYGNSKIGKVHKVESDSYALVRIDVASKSSETQPLTWATKQTASAFGRGQAWFSDIGAMGYSDGNNWKIVSNVKNVREFGVVGDEITDDTSALQSAISSLTTNNALDLDGLTFKISAAINATNKDKFKIIGNGATIKAADGMAVNGSSGLLYFTNCTDFYVENLTVDGNRANRTPAEVAAHSVNFKNCKRFECKSVTSNNAVVDGFYFNATTNTDSNTYCKDFRMIDCYADNCYRQGASVINAWDFEFIGGAYNNTNGTAPQAGIDVESNAGPSVDANTRGKFTNVRFEGNAGRGLLLVAVGGTNDMTVDNCYFSANAIGGIGSYIDNVRINNNTFLNHVSATLEGGVIAILEATSTYSVISNNYFNNNEIGALSCIYIDTLALNASINNNHIRNTTGTGSCIYIRGIQSTVNCNRIKTAGGVGINSIGAVDSTISQNYVTAATGRGIYSSSNRAKILHNSIFDIATVVGAYIQENGSGGIIDGNNCKSTSVVSYVGIRVDSSAIVVCNNRISNLSGSKAYQFITGIGATAFYNNAGGNIDGRTGTVDTRTAINGMGLNPSTTANRPAANTVAIGQPLFDTTLGKPVYSDGTDWRDSAGTIA